MLHSFWHKVPLVRLLLAFATGILSAVYTSPPMLISLMLLALSILSFFLAKHLSHSYRLRWIPGLFINSAFVALGMLVHYLQQPEAETTHITHLKDVYCYLVTVDEEPLPQQKTSRFRVRVTGAITNTRKQIPGCGYILVQAAADTLLTVHYGDVLCIMAGTTKPPPPPLNPMGFNYKEYLYNQHIFHQAFLTNQQVIHTGANRGQYWLKQVYAIQGFFSQTLARYLPGQTEAGIAKALLYGDDNSIDKETMSTYANTGTLHVLAVSGMHVSLLFYVFGQLLSWLSFSRISRLIKASLLLVFLWAYAVLCGLSPSILRATVMFSFIILGSLLERKGNIYNTLAASCLVLLFTNTNMLFNTGFQLSYLAVLGIVFFHPYINRWYTPSSWFHRQVWQIISVSIAAQLATTPISLLYFHQFPTCFLLSNLVVIPLTTIILYGCMLLLLISWWGAGAAILGKLLYVAISFTNKVTFFMGALPYAYAEGIMVDALMTMLLYVLLFAFTAYFLLQRTAWLQLTLFSLLCLLTVSGYHYLRNQQQQLLVVYALRQQAVVGVVQARHMRYFTTSPIQQYQQKFNTAIRPHVWQLNPTTCDTVLLKGWVQLQLGRKRVLINGPGRIAWHGPLHVLIVRNAIDTGLIQTWRPMLVVCCGSLSAKAVKRISSCCAAQNIPVYHVMESGAFQLSLQAYE